MPETKWFIYAIEQTITPTGYQIVIQTDIACHLWMRWTVIPPKQHPIQRQKRGLLWMMDKYYCFDAYHDNEQEEAGDTLIHTFIKEPWPICETRYFYFHGEIAGVPSPSTSCILSKHRTLEDYGPLVWIECNLSGDSVWWGAVDVNWNVVQTKAPGSIISNPLPFYRTAFDSVDYVIWRGAFQYDTSGIPVNSLIFDAYFRFYGRFSPAGPAPPHDHWAYMLDFPTWDGLDTASWYAFTNGLSDISCEFYVLAAWGDAWRQHTLTALGLSRILQGGLTKYLATTRYDVLDLNPGLGRRAFQWRRPAGFDPPTLHVQYRPLL